MTIYFVSGNKHKIKEINKVVKINNIEIVGHHMPLTEIQSTDIEKIAKDKALKAFKKIRKPLIVEQTGLYIEDFGGLPGGLTQPMWDALHAEKFCDFFGTRSNTKAKAVTVVAYCDGKKIHTFRGEIRGNIVRKPRGKRAFQWDCVFQPKGSNQTFAEMGKKKNKVSMRMQALKKLKSFLEGRR